MGPLKKLDRLPTGAHLRRDPTTAEHGDFCLLCFHPGPVRPSLDNLVTPGSPSVPILMPSLVRTPAPHRSPESRTPARKPSSNSGLQVAGLQEHATTPGRQPTVNDRLLKYHTSISFPKKLALALVANSKGGGGAGPVVNFFKYTFFCSFSRVKGRKGKGACVFWSLLYPTCNNNQFNHKLATTQSNRASNS